MKNFIRRLALSHYYVWCACLTYALLHTLAKELYHAARDAAADVADNLRQLADVDEMREAYSRAVYERWLKDAQ